MPAGAVGAARPVGAILPTATAVGPSFHEAMGGYAAPKSPAGQSSWDDDISVTGHACMALTKTNSAECCRGKLRCLSTDGTALAGQVNTELMRRSVVRPKPLIFDPLGNGNLALRINYQKVSRSNESQEVASKWGLGRSA